jgi:ribosomal protein L11 methyltransferase
VWISATLATDAAHVEPLAEALLAQGALCVSVEDADAGTERETPQFGEPGSPTTPLWATSRVTVDQGERRIARAHRRRRAMPASPICPSRAHEVAERTGCSSPSQFEPIRINERLWIVPSWHTAPDPTAICLELDPGMAFGTGSHPTTRLCLEWLCANIGPRDTVLDYGCGSGILGIAAAKLGAASVLGVDIDENALVAAQDNAQRNGVELALRHSRAALTETFDRVVANILTNPLCVLAPLLSGRVAPGGRIALSGILETQAQQVIDAYAPWLSLRVGATHEGWVRLEGERPAC